MRFKLSVRVRLTIWSCGVFFLGFVLLAISAYAGLRSTVVKVVDDELTSRLVGMDNFLGEHLVRLPVAKLQREISIHAALKPAYLVLQDPKGAYLYCGASVTHLCTDTAMTTTPMFSRTSDLRVLSVVHTFGGAPYRIRLASDLSFEMAILRDFSFWLLLIAPLAGLSAALGGYVLSGRALEPVRGIIREVHAIGEHSLDHRLHVPSTGDDIQLLTETLNGMLARVDRAFRQVRELTANASHELRTPISIIRTSAEIALLNARPTIESQRQALLQICAEAEKNTRLLDHMLMLARTDSGAQALQFSRVSLAKSVRLAIAACQHLAEAKQIVLRFSSDADTSLWADASHLHRLWLLLLDNAIKYTALGGEVHVRTYFGANGLAKCEIADNGIGIETADIQHIFDRFYRAENARLACEVGSGLGLEIAQWITGVHDATLTVDSAPGVGSTFRVAFAVRSETPRSESRRDDEGGVLDAASGTSLAQVTR